LANVVDLPAHRMGGRSAQGDLPWLPGYCESASIYGAACESTASIGQGAAAKGSWQLGSARDCIVRCGACPQCAFVSFSGKEEDCSWFASCNTSRLSQGATKHRTLRVRDSDGNIVTGARERQRRVHSDAELLEDLAHGFWQPRGRGKGAGKGRSKGSGSGGSESGGGGSGGDPRWVPSSGAELLPVTAATLARCHPRGRWLHVAGDSTARFFYAALLTLFDVDVPYPHHRAAAAHKCSFEHVGWPSGGACSDWWKGPCGGGRVVPGCKYDHTTSSGWRLTFSWWRHTLPPASAVWPLGTSGGSGGGGGGGDGGGGGAGGAGGNGSAHARAAPDLVFLSTGVHEIIWQQKNVSSYLEKVAHNIHALRTELYASAAAATASALTVVSALEQASPIQQQLQQRGHRNSHGNVELVLMLNGLCYGAQNERQGQPFFPSRAQERMVAAGNRWLRAWANAEVPRVPVLDRSVSMLVPPLDESPCFAHHPYGIMSELHVQIGLQALLC